MVVMEERELVRIEVNSLRPSDATHICVSNLSIIVSDNGLAIGRRQAIILTNTGILSIEHWEQTSVEF